MAKKQRLLHWDSRKKKFVKTTLAELSEGGKGGSRKIRTESGKLPCLSKHLRHVILCRTLCQVQHHFIQQ